MIYQPSDPDYELEAIRLLRWSWRKIERTILRDAMIERAWQNYTEEESAY